MLKFYKNLKIKTKIASSLTIIIILLIALVTSNFIQAGMVLNKVNHVIDSIDVYQENLWDLQVAFKNNTRVLEEYASGYLSLNEAEINFDKNYSILNAKLQVLDKAVNDGVIKKNELENIKKIREKRKQLASVVFKILDVTQNSKEIRFQMSELDSYTGQGEESIIHIQKELNTTKEKEVASISNTIFAAQLLMVVIPLIAILLSFILALLLIKTIAKPILKLSKIASKFSNDEFTELKIDSNDEIGDLYKSFNLMTGRLQQKTNEYKAKNEELEKRRTVMANTETAMLNILDDARDYEKDLDKFKVAIENTSEHIIITDSEGIIIYANKAAEDLTGYTFAEMKGNSPRLWGKQMPAEFFVKLWDTIKNQKQPFEGQILNKNKNGQLYSVYAKISPVLDGVGKILYFIGNERDISADLELANRLKKEKEIVEVQVKEQTKLLNDEHVKFTASINSLKIGFVMFDKNGLTLFNNRAFEKILGLNDKPSNLDEAQNLLTGFPLKEYFENCLDAGQPIEIKEVAFKDIFLHLFLAPIFSADNSFNIIGVVVLVEDITEEKIISRSRDEFFSIASHELRTPLTAIRGNTSLIKQYYMDKLPDEDVKGMISDINESSIRLIQIVNDFLNMSRLEMGKMVFKNETVNIVDLVKDVIKECEPSATKNLPLNLIEPTESIPQVFGDVARIREVLVNLIGNAIKYSEKGEINVSIKITGNMVKVLVKDTGRGISEANQKLLFRKFQQAASSIYTRDALKGTGLGLYISKLMMEGMGGRVDLEESVEGQGSTFSMSIPKVG